MWRSAAFILATSMSMTSIHADEPAIPNQTHPNETTYQEQVSHWQARRLQRLTAADGWLTLIGLEWLQPGSNTLGRAEHNSIVLKAGPADFGRITLAQDGTTTLEFAPGIHGRVDGREVSGAVLLGDQDGAREPSLVEVGSISLFVIDRDGRKGLRIKDSQAPSRSHFQGLDYFPIDPAWRVEARWVPFDPPHSLPIGSVLGTVSDTPVPGKAVFEKDGHRYELYPIQEEPGSLFFIIADRTSGKETYGAARFITTGLPHDGHLTIDFNEAYNPPCAFTAYATCPLPPPENRLDLRVTAGEKKYRGEH
ncbi:hypothetical protein Fraau_1659 [Frateuria aurantia DSM 6220]|uniref:DUF1684 domain-containing protein n=2 Tax=Frateuria aurantia TaxID=81475 RepID=H8KY79_FRAAD|nr:hypothetical protein Fraau_1659 [Frateuria aurantia DSM 6220]